MVRTTRSRVVLKPVATRHLQVVGHPRRKVVVEIGQPYFVDREWRCPYLIRGARCRRRRFACGEDSLQSLLLAFLAVRADLDAYPEPLAWLTDEPGAVWIPHQAPTYAGFAFQRKVERMMAKMQSEWALNQIAQGKVRQAKARRKKIRRTEDQLSALVARPQRSALSRSRVSARGDRPVSRR